MNRRISGVFAPVPTPVDRDGAFDAPALVKHLQWLESRGLDGAVVLGTNGEFPSFSLAERRSVAEAAAGAAPGLTMLLGVGSCAVGEVVDLESVAASTGYSGVLCPPPFYFRDASMEGLTDFFRRVLDASSLPVLLYHIPQVTGVAISSRLLDAIGDHPRLVGVKDSSGDPDEMDRLLLRFSDRSYLVGSDRLIARCRHGRGTGSITAAASVVPSLVAEVWDHGDRQQDLTAIRDLLEEFGLGPAVKAILRHRGFGDYAARPRLVGLNPGSESDLLERFESIDVGG